ncbi:VOC family protein [Aeromonas caviae]|uniref:VOC family protein n=1 Tax=Aeromonas caviae TaxID=648 RepID=UPI0038D1770B
MVFLLMGGAYLRSRIKQAGKWDQETIVSFFLCQYCSGEYLPAALGALTGRHHLAFQAQDRATVDRFYQAALAHGGQDNGAPGERAYHPGYYAAFVLDPDGNNIEAVYHGEAKRSAGSVVITF